METIVDGVKKQLLAKERKIGSEAPAFSVLMLNGETKVIGMMATQVQVMITLPLSDSLSAGLQEVIKKYSANSFIYILSCVTLDTVLNDANMTTDFSEFAKKFGVYVDETMCAKSIFIVNKDGNVVYKQITNDIADEFDLQDFDAKLNEAIHFKKKGHAHENWMST